MDYSVYINEHKELYQKLEYFLLEFTKLKNKRDDEFLILRSKELYSYLEGLLNEHFKEEEQKLFPEIKDQLEQEIYDKITGDHDEIRAKFASLKTKMQAFETNRELDYKTELLFPTYNLIATISHHAQREDKYIFEVELV